MKKEKNQGRHSAPPVQKKVKPREPKPERVEKAPVKPTKPARPEPSPEELKARRAKRSKKGVRLLISVIAVCILVLGACIGAMVGGYKVTNSGKIYPNIYVGRLPLGGLTREEAEEVLSESGWDASVSGTLKVNFPTEIQSKIDYIEAGAVHTQSELLERAVSYGRSGDWIGNLISYARCSVQAEDLTTRPVTLNREYIESVIAAAQEQFAKNTAGGTRIDTAKKTIFVNKTAEGTGIVAEDVYALIVDALRTGTTEIQYELPHTDQLVMPDFEAIRSEIYTEMKNAEYDGEKYEVVPSVTGVDINIEEAKKLWTEAAIGMIVEIPIIFTEPELSTEVLEEMLFRDCLGEQTTTLWGSTAARINNVSRAAASINEKILAPGEIFSYNDTVGKRTIEAGYDYAGAYDNGQVIQEVGGGICQVSSTLYCAALYGQMTTVERTCHMFAVTYLDPSMDATVSWGWPDFKFQNTREFPVKIVAYVNEEERSLTVEIWGTDVDGSYVELKSGMWYRYDTEYPDVVIGTGARLWRTVYAADGSFLWQEVENTSEYDYHEEDIKWPEDKKDDDDSAEGSGEGGEEAAGNE